MKLLEILGVIPGIEQTSQDMIAAFVRHLKSFSRSEIFSPEMQTLELGNVKLGNQVVDKVIIRLKHKNSYHSELTMTGASTDWTKESVATNRQGKLFMVGDDDSTDNPVVLDLEISSNSDPTVEDVLAFLYRNKSELISVVAHELHHVYVSEKTKYEFKVDKSIDYLTAVHMMRNTGILGLPGGEVYAKVFALMYYLHDIENHVRASELFALLKERGITKRTFVPFLKTTNMYKTLVFAEKLRIEDLVERVKKDLRLQNVLANVLFSHTLDTEEELLLGLGTIYEALQSLRSHIFSSFSVRPGTNLTTASIPKKMYTVLNPGNLRKINPKQALASFKRDIRNINKAATKAKRRLMKVYDLLPD